VPLSQSDNKGWSGDLVRLNLIDEALKARLDWRPATGSQACSRHMTAVAIRAIPAATDTLADLGDDAMG
jgi:hypothetical protein